jgi:hypothetical protein
VDLALVPACRAFDFLPDFLQKVITLESQLSTLRLIHLGKRPANDAGFNYLNRNLMVRMVHNA